MKKILITLLFSLFSVISFTYTCASNNHDNMRTNNVSKETVVYILLQGNVIIIDKVVQGKMRLIQLWINAKENDRAKNV